MKKKFALTAPKPTELEPELLDAETTVAELKAIIDSLITRVENLERINFHEEWNSKLKIAIKKSKD